MLKTLSIAGAALAMTATAIIPATPAAAQRYERGYQGDYGRGYNDYRGYDDRYARGYDDRYERRDYRQDRRYAYRNRSYRCNDGTTGTIVGAIAGGLLGNSIAGRGDRGLGTVLGGVGGALAGRAVERSGNNGCRR